MHYESEYTTLPNGIKAQTITCTRPECKWAATIPRTSAYLDRLPAIVKLAHNNSHESLAKLAAYGCKIA